MPRDSFDFATERARHQALYGREPVLAELERHVRGDARCVLLRGGYGRGKSALLCNYLDREERTGPVPHHFLRRSRPEWANPESVARSLTRQIEQQPRFRALRIVGGPTPGALVELLGRVSAEVLVPQKRRLVLVIYGLDEAERSGGEDPLACFLPKYPIAGVTLVCASRPTVDLSRLDAWSPRIIDLDGPVWRASNERACRELWLGAAPALKIPRSLALEAARRAEGNLLHCVELRGHLARLEPAARRDEPLPTGLRRLFADMWHRTTPAPEVRRGLGILCAARGPLPMALVAELAGCTTEAGRQMFAAAIAPLIVENPAAEPDEATTVQLQHDAFRQFAASQLLPAELASCHAALAARIGKWPPSDPAWRSYALVHGLRHRVAAADSGEAERLDRMLAPWSEAERFGQDLDRMLAQCRELGPEAMEADLALAAARCPEGDARRRWHDLLRAVRDESHWLRVAPAELPSLLYNRLRTFGWTPEALAAIPGMAERGPKWRLRHPLPAGRGGLIRTISTRTSLNDMGAYKSNAHSCAVTPDGAQILVGSRKGVITVWEVATGRELGVLRGHRYAVTSLELSPDGTFAVSASADRTLIVWDLATGLPRATLRGHGGAVWKCALVPGGVRVVSASEDRTLKVWRLDGRGAPVTLRGHRDDVKDCAVTPDGTRVVSASSDQTIRIWTLGGRQLGAPLRRRSEASCAITPDGASVVSLNERSAIAFWDLASRRETAAVTDPNTKVLGCAMVAGERPVILIRISDSVWIRDLHTGALYARIPGDCDACSVFAGGRLAVTLAASGVIKIWDIENARRASAEARTDSLGFCAVTGDGRSVVASSKTGVAQWSTRTGDREREGQSGRLAASGMTEDGRFVVCTDFSKVAQLWSPARPAARAFEALAPAGDRVSAAALSADGRWLALGTETGKVELRPRGSGGRRRKPIYAHRDGVDQCQLSARGDRLATGGSDGAVALWDLTGPRAVRIMRRVMNPEYSGFGVDALALAPDGRIMAFSATSTEIEIWQESGGRRRRLAGHTGYVAGCALLPDGRLVSVSEDRTLKLWHLESGQCQQTLYGAAPFVSVAATDNLIAAGDALGNVWMLEPRAQRKAAPPVGPVRERHAVLVGVDAFDDPDLPPLPNTRNDVRALADALAGAGFGQITSLHRGARRTPTLEGVRAALRAQQLHPDDLLLVHFSCHGVRIGGEPYLLMRDSACPAERQTALAVAEVVELMEASNARRRVLLVDACAAGLALGADGAPRVRVGTGGDAQEPSETASVPLFAPSVHALDARTDKYLHVLAEGAVSLFSTTAVQEAQEAGDHGGFTRSVIEAFDHVAHRGGGRLTIYDLIRHVTAFVRGSNAMGAAQDPTAEARLIGDFIIAERR